MNALKEIEPFINAIQAVSIQQVVFLSEYDPFHIEEGTGYTLYPNYTPEELEDFKDFMNFEYDNGFGGQRLFGTIWLKDGTWCTRGEYDGSEWWEHHKRPNIITRER